jgi:hypothetical protein
MNKPLGSKPTPVLSTFQRATLRLRRRFRNFSDFSELSSLAFGFVALTFLGAKGALSPDFVAKLKVALTNPIVLGILIILLSLVASGILTILSRRVFLQSETVRYGSVEFQGPLEPKKPTGMDYFASLAVASRSVAGTLFSRSGVYLIVGVMTAIFGIVLFFVTRNFMSPPGIDHTGSQVEYAVYLMQNAGVLILCELIAFFFLRQSRSVLDEFRHFDNLARYREEMFALLMFAKEENSGLTVQDILEKGHFFSRGDRLGSGETTELVESRKLEKSEIDLLAKIAEVIAASKKS